MAYIPYGFVQKQNGIVIEPQQAEVVKEIFQRYLNDDSLGGIVDFLFDQGILSPIDRENGHGRQSVNFCPTPSISATSSALRITLPFKSTGNRSSIIKISIRGRPSGTVHKMY